MTVSINNDRNLIEGLLEQSQRAQQQLLSSYGSYVFAQVARLIPSQAVCAASSPMANSAQPGPTSTLCQARPITSPSTTVIMMTIWTTSTVWAASRARV